MRRTANEGRALNRALNGLVGLLVLVLILAACGPGAEESDQTGPETTSSEEQPPADDQGDPIVIGFTMGLSGVWAPFDSEILDAAQIRIDELNEAGGVDGRPIETIVLDYQSEPDLNAANALELLEDDVDILITGVDFDFGSPAMIEAQDAGVVGFFSCASDPKAGDRMTIGDLIFTLCWSTANEGAVIAEWVAESQGWLNGYMFEDISIDYTKSLAEAIRQRFAELGGEIVGEDTFNALDEGLDVSAQVSRIRDMEDEIDVIFLPSWIPPAATVANQLRSAGIETPIIGGTANEGVLVEEIAGAIDEYYSVAFGCYAYCTGTDKPELAEFADKFEELTGEAPTTGYAMKGYDMLTLLALAIEEAGTTEANALRDALTELPPQDILSGVNNFTEEWNQPQLRDGSAIEFDGETWRFLERRTPEKVPDPLGLLGG